ncbi:MAG: OsmC family protein [Candidatus Thermoplasmatota archaeon]|nr:OsmC family protein [Candidatus Thermoplasmatota archaeon]
MMLTLIHPVHVRAYMRGIVRWKGGEDLEGENEYGVSMPMHTADSPNPVQMVLLAHGGCTLLDVITGLKHRMENVRDMWIELDSDRSEESPRKFTAVRMRYVIEGDVPQKLVERIIEKSHEKNCSVGAMVTGAGATLDWELEMRT